MGGGVQGYRKYLALSERSRSLLWVLTVALAVLIPFVGKPFHLDDPFWIWTAQQIQKHPLDFYGYQVNWFGSLDWIYKITKTPPLFSYLLALWGYGFGLTELSCHIFMLLVGLAAVYGMFRMAEEMSCSPFLATTISITCPLFVMSSTVVMCDLLMLMFWIWSLVWWYRALAVRSALFFLVSSLLSAACVLTKYNGVLLLPLLFLAAVFQQKKLTRSLFYLAIPAFFLLLYNWFSARLYHESLLKEVFFYLFNKKTHTPFLFLQPCATAFAFVGGGVFGGWPFSLLLVKKRELLIIALMSAGLLWSISSTAINLIWAVQCAIWIFGGIIILWLTVREGLERADSTNIVLGTWLLITFFFAVFFNWSINGRGMITLLPAVGLMIARARPEWGQMPRARILFWASPALLCSWLVGYADFSMASVAKSAADTLTSEFNRQNPARRTLWFEGHWGFQYYMEKNGAKAIDFYESPVKADDVLVVPINNADLQAPPADVSLLRKLEFPIAVPITVMNRTTQAGYYAHSWGSLPFVFGLRGVESIYVFSFLNARRGLVDRERHK